MKALYFNFILVTAALLVSFGTKAATPIVELKSDKSTYTEGEVPVLRANLFSQPDSSDYQFDLVATLNEAPIDVDRVTDFQMFSSPKDLEAGEYNWEVTVVVQDARYARDLKDSIIYYTNLIADLDDQIAVETDPDILADLNAKKDSAVSIKAAAQSELTSIRTPVLAPLSLTFTVEEAK